MARTNNQFNFEKYNELMKDANLGLKLHLGVQLIKDTVSSLEFFDNPLEAELRPVYIDLKKFHALYKDEAKARAAKAENESERTAGIDNSTLPQTGVADMQAMFVQLQRMLAAQAAGNNAVAVTAEEGIKELQNGVLHNVDTEQKAA
jgi:hypothetical protein